MKKSELPDTLEVLKGIFTLIIEVQTALISFDCLKCYFPKCHGPMATFPMVFS